MKVKDFQLPLYLIKRELGLSLTEQSRLLEIGVRILSTGESDLIINRGHEIVFLNPSSPAKFLFNLLYTLLKNNVESDFDKDTISLALLEICRQYVHYDPFVSKNTTFPVLSTFHKNKLPSLILTEIIEPLTGKLLFPKILLLECPFTDCCRIINNYSELAFYNFKQSSISFDGDYPLILSNTRIHNSAAYHADLIYSVIKLNYGEDESQKILTNILLNQDIIYERIITIIKVIDGSLLKMADFMKYLKSHVNFNEIDYNESLDIETKKVEDDSYFSGIIKKSSDGYMSSRVNRQWTEVSMMIGLIEKQLEPARGSLWPASENLLPIENEKRQRILDYAKKHKKHPWELTFDQLLEISRDWYNHNVVSPGKLYEELLRDNRAWKN